MGINFGQPSQIGNDAISAAPCAITMGSTIYIFIKGSGNKNALGNYLLYYRKYTPATSSIISGGATYISASGNVPLLDRPNAVGDTNGLIYIFFANALSTSNNINFLIMDTTNSDSVSVPANQPTVNTNHPVSAIIWFSVLYLFWTDATTNLIYFSSYITGNPWSTPQALTGLYSEKGPVAMFNGGLLYIFYTATSNSTPSVITLNSNAFLASTQYTGTTLPTIKPPLNSLLEPFDGGINNLLLFYTLTDDENDPSNNVYYATLWGESTSVQVSGISSSKVPSVVYCHGSLYMFYEEANAASNNFYYCSSPNYTITG